MDVCTGENEECDIEIHMEEFGRESTMQRVFNDIVCGVVNKGWEYAVVKSQETGLKQTILMCCLGWMNTLAASPAASY